MSIREEIKSIINSFMKMSCDEYCDYVNQLGYTADKILSIIENDKWISVDEKLPEHGDHVLVWDLRDNVYPFPRGNKGDDGEGRSRYGDAIFFDKKVKWDDYPNELKSHWNDFEDYISINGPRYVWSGHGPCSFGQVTHWQPLPEPPKGAQS